MKRGPGRRWAKLVIVNLVVLAAILATLELVFWLIEPDGRAVALVADGSAVPIQRESEFPAAGYTLVPGARGHTYANSVVINSLGMRDRELALRPGGLRLAVVGDSVAFGWGVDVAESFPEVVERLLRDAHPAIDIEVVNLGVPILNTSNEYHRLTQRYAAIDFDLVLVGFFFNDAEQTGEAVMGRPQFPAWSGMLGASAIGRRLVVAAIRRQLHRGAAQQIERTFTPGYPGWRQLVSALDGFARFAERRPVHFALLPAAHAFEPNGPEEHAYRLVEAELRNRGLPYHNVAERLQGLALSEMAVSAIDLHPNAELHAHIAAEIFAYLTSHRVIETLLKGRTAGVIRR